jgi:hypothetical protein
VALLLKRMQEDPVTAEAVDLVKQLITLATSIVTFSFVFGKDLLEIVHSRQLLRFAAFSAWSLYLLSALAGVFALMAILGWRIRGQASASTPIAAQSNVRLFASLQIIVLGLALIATLVFGYLLSFNTTVHRSA